MKFIAMNRFKIVPKREQDFENIWKNRETHLKGNLRKQTHCMHPILLGILVKISNLGRNQTHFVFHTKVQEFIVEFILGILNLRVLKLLFRSGGSDTDSQPQEPTPGLP